MSDLNLRIAELIEPKPTRSGERYVSGLDETKAWRWIAVAHVGLFTDYGWQPRAFDSDAQCTVMLMERLMRVLDLKPYYRQRIGDRDSFTIKWEYRGIEHQVEGLTLGLAVALAFLEAHDKGSE